MKQKNKKFLKERNKGYTLIELMAVLFIIALISSMVLANYRKSQKRYAFNFEVQSLAQFIRDSQNRAIASATIGNLVPEGGFGVYINKASQKIILYGDLDQNKLYTDGEEINFFNLNKAEINNLFSSDPNCPNYSNLNQVSINFIPPNPLTFITPNGSDACSQVSIELKSRQDASLKKIIDVFNTGLIQISKLK